MLQNNENPYLSYQDVMGICQEQGIDESQAKLFIRISHELGHLIHYDYDSKLNNIVILKPDWLAKAISFVLDDPATRKNKGFEPLLDWQTRSDAPELSQGEAIRAQGSVIRELHALLKEKDPSFGGGIRVQNPRREFLWVHPQFKDEY